ncbi:hypothetical protein QBC37DRAFT_124489 [Rhypophila decipiens]|uniref:Uncharacterized protein n=1 Tax=Rhypophila decipiens TaxID=261697 RepID=A0AAN6XTV9_9PEZI|nr:hypothetical protein QBC37DRAFT_124489 [Rhypophila decipiens]
MAPFLDHYFSPRPFADPCDVTVIAAMCRLCNTIVRLTDLYSLHASQILMGSGGCDSRSTTTTLVTPLSTAEKTRFHRAFLRYELYSRAFPYGENRKSLIDGHGQFHLFIRHLKPWEVEELYCIHHYLTSLAAGYLADIEDQFVDAFRSCPGVQLRQQPRKRVKLCDYADSGSSSCGDESSEADHSTPLPNPKRRRLTGTPLVPLANRKQGTRRRVPSTKLAEKKKVKPTQEMVSFHHAGLHGLYLFKTRTGGNHFKFARYLTSFGLGFSMKLIDASDDPKRRRELIYAAPNAPNGREFLFEALRHLPPPQVSPTFDIDRNPGPIPYVVLTLDSTGRYAMPVPHTVSVDNEEDPDQPSYGYSRVSPRLRYDGYVHPTFNLMQTWASVWDIRGTYDPLREMGLVFWDKGRLGTSDAQQNIDKAAAGDLDEENRKRLRKRSVLHRETVKTRLKGIKIPASQWSRLFQDYTMDRNNDQPGVERG